MIVGEMSIDVMEKIKGIGIMLVVIFFIVTVLFALVYAVSAVWWGGFFNIYTESFGLIEMFMLYCLKILVTMFFLGCLSPAIYHLVGLLKFLTEELKK